MNLNNVAEVYQRRGPIARAIRTIVTGFLLLLVVAVAFWAYGYYKTGSITGAASYWWNLGQDRLAAVRVVDPFKRTPINEVRTSSSSSTTSLPVASTTTTMPTPLSATAPPVSTVTGPPLTPSMPVSEMVSEPPSPTTEGTQAPAPTVPAPVVSPREAELEQKLNELNQKIDQIKSARTSEPAGSELQQKAEEQAFAALTELTSIVKEERARRAALGPSAVPAEPQVPVAPAPSAPSVPDGGPMHQFFQAVSSFFGSVAAEFRYWTSGIQAQTPAPKPATAKVVREQPAPASAPTPSVDTRSCQEGNLTTEQCAALYRE